ncbi:transmembrane protein 248 isoform X2 [Procambarus clarkii]|uniref:transmembrane protein 248 isoform X2 n=1 Tax=Procambarus clarkii TaxID=6728 RepID=UPI001E676DBA|nr:transmembrane protein 248-like isoform X2 [Procambarus clarkii]
MGVCSSMRECVGSKPPLAVFAASIAAFAIALVGVSLYLQGHRSEILNPDIKDWNSFYSTLSDMKICFPESGASRVTKIRPNNDLPSVVTLNSERSVNETEANVTLSILADVQVGKGGSTVMGMALHSLLPAKYLGFKGDPSALEVMIELASKTAKNWTACMMFSGPAHLLPDSPVAPANCTILKDTNTVEVMMGQPWLVKESGEWCSAGVEADLMVTAQHELNVYLSEGDVTLIQVHILYTTCLLCVMMLVLLFYFVCGKHFNSRNKTEKAADKIPLHA